MKKKVLAILLVLSLVVALASCTLARTTTSVEILTKDGGGNKTIVVSIPKYKDDGNFDDEQEKFFPQGFEPVKEFIQETLGDDYEVTFEEKEDSWDYVVKFSFDNIDDYNAKMRAMMTDNTWSEWAEPYDGGIASIEVEEADGGWNVTFTENVFANKAAVVGIIERLREQDDIFDESRGAADGKEVCDKNGHEVLKTVEVKVGDNSDSLTSTLVDPDKSLVDDGDQTQLVVTGFISADGSSDNGDKTPAPSGGDDKSPQTGDYGLVFAIIMLLASTVVLTSRKLVKSK